mgnify:CR=1 FL=1
MVVLRGSVKCCSHLCVWFIFFDFSLPKTILQTLFSCGWINNNLFLESNIQNTFIMPVDHNKVNSNVTLHVFIQFVLIGTLLPWLPNTNMSNKWEHWSQLPLNYWKNRYNIKMQKCVISFGIQYIYKQHEALRYVHSSRWLDFS